MDKKNLNLTSKIKIIKVKNLQLHQTRVNSNKKVLYQ